MIYQDNQVMITLVPIRLATARAALQKMRWAHCDQVSLYRRNGVLANIKDKFQESETSGHCLFLGFCPSFFPAFPCKFLIFSFSSGLPHLSFINYSSILFPFHLFYFYPFDLFIHPFLFHPLFSIRQASFLQGCFSASCTFFTF